MRAPFARVGSAPIVAMLALVLCAGCEVVSAQGLPDAGSTARVARDGGARRQRADAAAVDGGSPRDAGPRRARRDAGPRRARRDAGTDRALDAEVSLGPDASASVVADASASAFADASTLVGPDEGPSVAPDPTTSLALDAGVASALAIETSIGPRVDLDPALDAGVVLAPDAGAVELLTIDAAVLEDAGAVPDAAMQDDAGASSALPLDAGVPSSPIVADAGAASATGAPPFDPWELIARLGGDHEERAPTPATVAPLPGVDVAIRERLETLVPALPSGRASMFALLVLLLGAVVVARTLGRMRRALPDRGVIPRTLAIAHGLTRLAIAMLVLALIAELLPDWTRSALPWVVVACAVALGWSARDLLPDLVAGAVLLTERRVSRGQHLVVGGHEGVVTDVGIRVTSLRDISGRELRVPNRIVLSSPTTTRRSRWHAITVRVRAPHGASADAFARALREAVLLSPWVPLPSVVEIARDPGESDAFEVRTTLLDLRFEARFRGELLARAEAVLRAERTNAIASEPPP